MDTTFHSNVADLGAAAADACTPMTSRMPAPRKGSPLAVVSVDVTHDRVRARDAQADGEGAADEGARHKVDLLRRVVRLGGELDPERRARLMAIADRCPVHRPLERGARVEIEAG